MLIPAQQNGHCITMLPVQQMFKRRFPESSCLCLCLSACQSSFMTKPCSMLCADPHKSTQNHHQSSAETGSGKPAKLPCTLTHAQLPCISARGTLAGSGMQTGCSPCLRMCSVRVGWPRGQNSSETWTAAKGLTLAGSPQRACAGDTMISITYMHPAGMPFWRCCDELQLLHNGKAFAAQRPAATSCQQIGNNPPDSVHCCLVADGIS